MTSTGRCYLLYWALISHIGHHTWILTNFRGIAGVQHSSNHQNCKLNYIVRFKARRPLFLKIYPNLVHLKHWVNIRLRNSGRNVLCCSSINLSMSSESSGLKSLTENSLECPIHSPLHFGHNLRNSIKSNSCLFSSFIKKWVWVRFIKGYCYSFQRCNLDFASCLYIYCMLDLNLKSRKKGEETEKMLWLQI